jgi:hypothetical protein
MIVALTVLLVVLIGAAWGTAMYASWKQSEGCTPTPFDPEAITAYFDKITRMIRRGYYSSMFYSKQTAVWGNRKLGSAFFTFFPDAAPAFAKRDMLIGLKDGPSSYFLMSISEEKPRPKTRRRRKIV